MKVALITGITGQDGSYLSELLLEKDYVVYGIIRRSSSLNTGRIDHIFDRLRLRYGDLVDPVALTNILAEIKNSHLEMEWLEVYNLAAQSHVKVSFELPEYTGQVDALGTLRLLEAIRSTGLTEKVRFYQASTSELFGKVQTVPQNEETPFYPRSPYGVAKLYAYWIVKNFRESYGMFASNGILFNHESPRRGHNFVTRKVTMGLGKILRGETDRLVMGNLDALRDWGHAKDYVKAMWMMMQHPEAGDWVVSTGEMHSVREFIELCFARKGFVIQWKGEGTKEIGYDRETGRELVFVDEKYFRPAEVEQLLGDSSKIRHEIGWIPEISFEQLVEEMVTSDTPQN